MAGAQSINSPPIGKYTFPPPTSRRTRARRSPRDKHLSPPLPPAKSAIAVPANARGAGIERAAGDRRGAVGRSRCGRTVFWRVRRTGPIRDRGGGAPRAEGTRRRGSSRTGFARRCRARDGGARRRGPFGAEGGREEEAHGPRVPQALLIPGYSRLYLFLSHLENARRRQVRPFPCPSGGLA